MRIWPCFGRHPGGRVQPTRGRAHESRRVAERRQGRDGYAAVARRRGAGGGVGGAPAAVGGLPRAEAQPAADVSGELVACVAGGAWETAFREHMAQPVSQKYSKEKLPLDLAR